MVAVPFRADVLVLSLQETVTEPDPVPLAGETLSHEPFPDAVQLPPVQPDGEPVSVTCCAPAAAEALAEVGETVNELQVDRVVEMS